MSGNLYPCYSFHSVTLLTNFALVSKLGRLDLDTKESIIKISEMVRGKRRVL